MVALSRRTFALGSLAAAASLALPKARANEAIAVGVDAARSARIRDRVERFLRTFRIPGLSLAHAIDRGIVYAASFGFADRRRSIPLQISHRFRIASVSKPITASAIMLLHERGRLSLDRKVFGRDGILSPLVGDLTPLRPEWIEAITVDHLLTHTAGGWASDAFDPTFRDVELSQRDLIRSTFARQPLDHEPGTEFAYSNFGYCLLGRVIEAVTGQGYQAFVRAEILGPAGAGGMSIGGSTEAERRPDEVFYYDRDGWNPYAINLTRMDSHGGWIATPSELVSFVLHLDGYSAVPDLLLQPTLRLMRSPPPASPGYARGWYVDPLLHNNWSHDGSLAGSKSLLVRVENGSSMAGLINGRVGGEPNLGLALDALMWDVHAEVTGSSRPALQDLIGPLCCR